MSAHEANWMLRKKPSGTFLIRFSKSQAGCFAVTFVDSKCQVKHSLLYSLTDQWGLTLKNPPKGKKLYDFYNGYFRIYFAPIMRYLLFLFSAKRLQQLAIYAYCIVFTFSGNLNLISVTHRAIITQFSCSDVRSAFDILLSVHINL